MFAGAPASPAATTGQPEWDLLRLMNRARWEHGLPPLAMFAPLREQSRGWSSNMAADRNLRHDPALAKSVSKVHARWTRIGENVGTGDDVGRLHQAFMASPGHRANLLGQFGYVGVGSVRVGSRLWVTVRFLATRSVLPTTTRVPVRRLASTDAVATSVLVSRGRPARSADAVVVATAGAFPDALAGAPLAVKNKGPVLLSKPETASSALVEEAVRVLSPAGVVYLLGGPSALSPNVELAFANRGLKVTRIAGADRYATATAVASYVDANPRTVFLVSGSAFPDAVLASAPAASMGAPILLLPPRAASFTATNFYLLTNQPSRRIIVGGTDAVPPGVALEAGGTERVAGPDRYATAVEVGEHFFPHARTFVLATGSHFADALIGSPDAARDGGPVLLTMSPLAQVTYDYVDQRLPLWSDATVIGGPAAVPDAAVTLLLS